MLTGPYGAMAELAASLHGAVTRLQAADLGVSSRDVAAAKRAGLITEPTPGVLVFRSYPCTWMQQVRVALAGDRVVTPYASHRAAARLHRVGGLERFEPVELSVERPSRYRRQLPFPVIAHHVESIPPDDVILLNGLPVTGLARTLADLGSVVPQDVVRRALIDARRIHRVSPVWLNRTAIRLHRPGQHGTAALLHELHRWANEGRVPDTWFEELIEVMLARSDIPPLVRQYGIHDARGVLLARVDLAIPAARLAIEAHSRRFHFGPEREEADEDRDLRLSAERLGGGLPRVVLPAQA